MKKLFFASCLLLNILISACSGKSECGKDESACNSGCDSIKICETTTCNPEELAGIEKALGFYTEAAVKGDSRIAMQGFAPGATMSYAEGDCLVTVPIQALYDYYDTTGPHNAIYEISSCSVADDVAMVRIESKFGNAEFSDMFTLVKDGKDWKIVSKVYHVK